MGGSVSSTIGVVDDGVELPALKTTEKREQRTLLATLTFS